MIPLFTVSRLVARFPASLGAKVLVSRSPIRLQHALPRRTLFTATTTRLAPIASGTKSAKKATKPKPATKRVSAKKPVPKKKAKVAPKKAVKKKVVKKKAAPKKKKVAAKKPKERSTLCLSGHYLTCSYFFIRVGRFTAEELPPKYPATIFALWCKERMGEFGRKLTRDEAIQSVRDSAKAWVMLTPEEKQARAHTNSAIKSQLI